MSYSYTYSISSDFGGGYKNFQFLREIRFNESIPNVRNVRKKNDTIIFYFDNELSGAEESTLNSLVSAHNPQTLINIGENLNQLNGTSSPTSSNDEVDGFDIGSIWRDTTDSNNIYICQDPSKNSATWTSITNSSSGSQTSHYVESSAISSTTGQGFKKKTSLTFNANAATYLVSWYAEVYASYDKERVNFRVRQDQQTNLAEIEFNPDIKSSTGYGPISGFAEITLSSGNVTFDMDYASTKGGKSVSIRRARLRAVQIN